MIFAAKVRGGSGAKQIEARLSPPSRTPKVHWVLNPTRMRPAGRHGRGWPCLVALASGVSVSRQPVGGIDWMSVVLRSRVSRLKASPCTVVPLCVRISESVPKQRQFNGPFKHGRFYEKGEPITGTRVSFTKYGARDIGVAAGDRSTYKRTLAEPPGQPHRRLPASSPTFRAVCGRREAI